MPMTADDLAAESQTDRIARLALAAGRYKRERDEAREAIARVEALVGAWAASSESGPVTRSHVAQIRRALAGE